MTKLPLEAVSTETLFNEDTPAVNFHLVFKPEIDDSRVCVFVPFISVTLGQFEVKYIDGIVSSMRNEIAKFAVNQKLTINGYSRIIENLKIKYPGSTIECADWNDLLSQVGQLISKEPKYSLKGKFSFYVNDRTVGVYDNIGFKMPIAIFKSRMLVTPKHSMKLLSDELAEMLFTDFSKSTYEVWLEKAKSQLQEWRTYDLVVQMLSSSKDWESCRVNAPDVVRGYW